MLVEFKKGGGIGLKDWDHVQIGLLARCLSILRGLEKGLSGWVGVCGIEKGMTSETRWLYLGRKSGHMLHVENIGNNVETK